MFYEVYYEGHYSSARRFKEFCNAYSAWVDMSTENPVVKEILMSGLERAEHRLRQESGIRLEYGDTILDTEYFED
jgi:hypothetical protein